MSRWTPCKRTEFIRRLRKVGFDPRCRHPLRVFTSVPELLSTGSRIHLWRYSRIPSGFTG